MKQSTGRLHARQTRRAAVLGLAAAVAAGVAACGGKNDNTCHNLPQAIGVVGQASFLTNTPNAGGVSASTLGGVQGAVATNGTDFYVADTSNNRILGYTSLPTGIAGAAAFIIGQTSPTEASAGTAPAGGSPVKFNNPSKVWVDPTGTYLVVADASNNRVLIWNTLPVSNTAPNVVVGQPDLTTGDINHPTGTPSASSLSNPTSAVIANGKLIVADKGNNRVLIWNTVPTASGTAADFELGQGPQGGAGDFTDNIANIDQFNNVTSSYTLAMRQPSDVWTNGSRLLVTDTGNHRVLSWNAIPNVQNKLADNLIGVSQFGSTSLNGSSGTQGLNSPWGVGSDGTSVFVADTGNNRVMEFQNYLITTRNGPAADRVFGQQDFSHITANDPDQDSKVGDQRDDPVTTGVKAGTMFNPQGILASSANYLFVTDSGNSRVLRFTITNADGTNTGVDGTDTDDGNFCF